MILIFCLSNKIFPMNVKWVCCVLCLHYILYSAISALSPVCVYHMIFLKFYSAITFLLYYIYDCCFKVDSSLIRSFINCHAGIKFNITREKSYFSDTSHFSRMRYVQQITVCIVNVVHGKISTWQAYSDSHC